MAITEIIKNKKYQIIVSYRNELGLPRNRKKIVNGTEKDARAVEGKMYKDLEHGFNDSMSIENVFFHYIEHKNNSNDETIRKEKEIYRKYISVYSKKKMIYLKPIDILKIRMSIEKESGSITQKNKSLYLLKRIMNHGRKYFNFPDYSDDVELIKKTVSDKFIYQTYTPDEFESVLECVTGENYKLLYEVYYWGGLRRGEALALSPNDLLDTKEIRINKSISSSLKLGPPKNENSYRNVKIHSDLYNRLVPFGKSNGKTLFGGDRYLPPSTVNGRFTRAIIRANKKRLKKGMYELPHIRIHDLRHSHATFLASQGAPIAAVSARLGHASINETMSTYTHLFKGDDSRIVEIIEKLKGTTKETTSDEK